MRKAFKTCLLVPIVLVGAMLLSKDVKAAGCNASTPCGNTCTYGGVTYKTVIIGTQCWFKENLNVGAMIGNLETPDNIAPTLNNPSTAQKWCYDDSLTNCTNEGGLYTWAEVNALPNSCNSASCSVPTANQGICPPGWHIPSDAEFYTLENYLTTPGETCDPARIEWGCPGAGAKLVLGGDSGFDAVRAGNHETNGELSIFDKREPSVHIWSSSIFGGNYGHNRTMIYQLTPDSMVSRNMSKMTQGFSARCLANKTVIGPPTKISQCKKKGWKTFNNPTFKNQGSCIIYVLKQKFLDKLKKHR